MAKSIENQIRVLQHTINTAFENYEIWWVYKSVDTRPKYEEAMNYYLAFFSASIHAHFTAMITAIYRLYETRKETCSFPNLLRELEAEGKFSEEIHSEVKNTIETIVKPIWIKVGIIRNSQFAHKSINEDYLDTFQQANIRYKDFRTIIELSKELLNKISSEYSNLILDLTASSNETMILLLDDINSCLQQRKQT